MKGGYRVGYFEVVCVLGVIATTMAYSVSEFHFTLTLLLVVVLGILAVVHDTARGDKTAGPNRGNRPGNSAPINSASPRLIHPRRVTLASSEHRPSLK